MQHVKNVKNDELVSALVPLMMAKMSPKTAARYIVEEGLIECRYDVKPSTRDIDGNLVYPSQIEFDVKQMTRKVTSLLGEVYVAKNAAFQGLYAGNSAEILAICEQLADWLPQYAEPKKTTDTIAVRDSKAKTTVLEINSTIADKFKKPLFPSIAETIQTRDTEKNEIPTELAVN